MVVAGVIARAHEAGLSAATGAEARMAGEVPGSGITRVTCEYSLTV